MKVAVVEMKALEGQFLVALKDGFDGLQRAGELLVKMVDADPNTRDRLVQEHGIQHSVLNTLEKIGRGSLLPRIALAGGRLVRLSVGDQRRAVEGTVPVLVMANGKVDTLQSNLLRAPKEILDQVVNGDHIRTIDEQRAYLTAKENSVAAHNERESAEGMPWRVKGRTIEILRPIKVLTRADLLTMMKALEG
jgi:hypothetical protein